MIVSCKKCGKGISDKAIRCPHCGASQTESSSKKWIIILVVLLLVGGAYAYVSMQKDDIEKASASETTEQFYGDPEEEEEEEEPCEIYEVEEVCSPEEISVDVDLLRLNHNYQ